MKAADRDDGLSRIDIPEETVYLDATHMYDDELLHGCDRLLGNEILMTAEGCHWVVTAVDGHHVEIASVKRDDDGRIQPLPDGESDRINWHEKGGYFRAVGVARDGWDNDEGGNSDDGDDEGDDGGDDGTLWNRYSVDPTEPMKRLDPEQIAD